MALFEGSVAFVMIAAVMKSMDPSLEEASQVIGASRLRTMLRITLPLVVPGVLGAAIFVFAEMLGSFAVALTCSACPTATTSSPRQSTNSCSNTRQRYRRRLRWAYRCSP